MEKTERYNYVFDQYDGDSFIYDLEENKRIEDLSECADILNKKEKEIERLTKSFANKNNEDLSTTINGVKFTTEQIIALQQVGYSAEYDQNQTAIAELEKLKRELEFTSNNNEWITARDDRILNGVCDCIDQQIAKLKGEEMCERLFKALKIKETEEN